LEISEARRKVGCPEGGDTEAWFRGHTRADFKLLPSVLRAFTEPNGDNNWHVVFNKESELFWEFAARARELHGVIEDDWDILFAMQYYGTPTRLLDWIASFAVAVYLCDAQCFWLPVNRVASQLPFASRLMGLESI